MVSLIEQLFTNETRENQEVSDYVCTSSSSLVSVLFGKLRVDRTSGYLFKRDRPNFDERCLCIYRLV